MDAIFKKLNFKAQPLGCVVDAPGAFMPHIAGMEGIAEIHQEIAPHTEYPFFLGFVRDITRLETLAKRLEGVLLEDGLFWISYPKKSSKQYKTDLSRDHGWTSIGALGYEVVRQVAIDADWSAFRFRKAELIASMKRRNSMALSPEGKSRTKDNK